MPELDAVVVPVGGGGLISGVAIALKSLDPEIRIIAVQSAASPALQKSLQDQHCYEEFPVEYSIAEGVAGGIGKIVYELAPKWIDEIMNIEEEFIPPVIGQLLRYEQKGRGSLRRHCNCRSSPDRKRAARLPRCGHCIRRQSGSQPHERHPASTVGAELSTESGNNTAIASEIFGTSDTLFPKSAPPSVEVDGGVSSQGAAICAIQASEAAYEFYGTRSKAANWRNCSAPTAFGFSTGSGAELSTESGNNTAIASEIFGTSDTLFPKSAPPSVEVDGGVSSQGAAICAIQASEAAYDSAVTRINGCQIVRIAVPLQI